MCFSDIPIIFFLHCDADLRILSFGNSHFWVTVWWLSSNRFNAFYKILTHVTKQIYGQVSASIFEVWSNYFHLLENLYPEKCLSSSRNSVRQSVDVILNSRLCPKMFRLLHTIQKKILFIIISKKFESTHPLSAKDRAKL